MYMQASMKACVHMSVYMYARVNMYACMYVGNIEERLTEKVLSSNRFV